LQGGAQNLSILLKTQRSSSIMPVLIISATRASSSLRTAGTPDEGGRARRAAVVRLALAGAARTLLAAGRGRAHGARAAFMVAAEECMPACL
jgi:hypothetical protein